MKRSLLACIALLFTCMAVPQTAQAALATCVTSMNIRIGGPMQLQYNYIITYNTNGTEYPPFITKPTATFNLPNNNVLVTEAYLVSFIPEAKATASSLPSLSGLPACNSATFKPIIDSSGVDYRIANEVYNYNHKLCPANATWQTTVGGCQCNTGYQMKTVDGTCNLPAVVCNGGTIDGNNNCTCPASSTLQGTTKNGTCIAKCVGGTLIANNTSCFCPTGTTWQNGVCTKPTPAKTCPAGSTLSGSACVCNAGYISVNGTCVAAAKCAANATPNASNQCVCNAGYTLTNGACVVACPAGSTLSGTKCVPITCPTGTQLSGSSCVAITCAAGSHLEGSSCVKNPACTGGKVSANGLGCECPAGTTSSGGNCVKNVPSDWVDGKLCTNGKMVNGGCECNAGYTFNVGACWRANQTTTWSCTMQGSMTANLAIASAVQKPGYPLLTGPLNVSVGYQVYTYSYNAANPAVTSKMSVVNKSYTTNNVNVATMDGVIQRYKPNLQNPAAYTGAPACKAYISAAGQAVPGYSYTAYKTVANTNRQPVTGF